LLMVLVFKRLRLRFNNADFAENADRRISIYDKKIDR